MLQKISAYYQNLTISHYIAIMLPFTLYIAHAQLFKQWIIDDAGISFVYARNLAHGYGLVSQPGNPPVEGFSNFSWVLLLTPFFFTNLFHPIIVPKLISGVLVLFSFIILRKTFALISSHSSLITIVTLSLLAMNTSFVIWTTSGLENPLYVFLLSFFFFFIVLASKKKYSGWAIGGALGVLAAVIAMTRPDGISYFFVFPAFLVIDLVCRKWVFWRLSLTRILYYTLSFGLSFGGFLIFRYKYFGDLLPNTYYAKGGPPTIWELLPKSYDLLVSVTGPFGSLTLIWLVGATIYLIRSKDYKEPQLISLILLACSASIYILLPEDWMGEYRFATAFFVFFYAYVIIVGVAIFSSLSLRKSLKVFSLILLIITFIVPGTFLFIGRSFRFAHNPTVPFSSVAERFGYRFNEYMARLDIKEGSILLPDLGGTLYYSDLRVYDLAGLSDRTIARTRGKDQELFYDYVFKTVKPTFIHTHGIWAYRAAFDRDHRFRRDYFPIRESPDPWVKDNFGLTIYSGDYVRKDIGRDKLEDLLTIKANSP